jgi:hypothetical protein
VDDGQAIEPVIDSKGGLLVAFDLAWADACAEEDASSPWRDLSCYLQFDGISFFVVGIKLCIERR